MVLVTSNEHCNNNIGDDGSFSKQKEEEQMKDVNSVQKIDSEIIETLIREKNTTHGSLRMGHYVTAHLREHAVLKQAREHANTEMGPLQAMQISADEGALLQMLIRMIHAKKIY